MVETDRERLMKESEQEYIRQLHEELTTEKRRKKRRKDIDEKVAEAHYQAMLNFIRYYFKEDP